MTKSAFIGDYLSKHMKNHNLPYSFAYFNLLAETQKRAEAKYRKHIKTKSN